MKQLLNLLTDKKLVVSHPEINIFKDRRDGTLLTTKQVETMFAVTPTSIHNWRRKSQFPAHHLHAPGLKKPPVRFDHGEVVYWSELNHVKIVNPIDLDALKQWAIN